MSRHQLLWKNNGPESNLEAAQMQQDFLKDNIEKSSSSNPHLSNFMSGPFSHKT